MSTVNEQNVIPPPPYNISFTDQNGKVSQPWSQWLQQMWIRVGREIALTNVQLETVQQIDLEDVQADILAIQALDTAQNTQISFLLAEVEGLRLAPLA